MGLAMSFIGFLDAVKIVLFYSWWLIIIITLYIMKRRWSKFPLEAVLIEKRGDNLIKTNDRVGKREDKTTGMTYYQFLKSKDTIPVYDFDWILHSVVVHTNIFERLVNLLRPTIGTIFLFKYGTKQYKPININQKETNKLQLKEIKDKDGKPIYIHQYAQFDPRWVIKELEFDVIDWDDMNFMVQEQRASMVRRQKKGEFWKQTLIPMIIIASCVVIAIFILKFSADAGADLRGGGGSVPQGDSSGSKLVGGITDAFTPGE